MPEAHRTATVIGHPIAHSRSPLIHRHWIERYDVTGDYGTEDVAPSDLPRWLSSRSPDHTPGGNITVPHKEAVYRWLGPSRVDEEAWRIGAVNTWWFEGTEMRGSCTDGLGFAADLDARAPRWREAEHALVLGAGGAARAIVHTLRRAGLAVTIANRTLERAQGLADEFGARGAIALSDTEEALQSVGLVVNTTTLGMAGEEHGGSEELPHLDPRSFREGQIAYDIVYVPLETTFLRAARRSGALGVDGLGMLLHQAVPGFHRWFGIEPEVTPLLRRVVEATL